MCNFFVFDIMYLITILQMVIQCNGERNVFIKAWGSPVLELGFELKDYVLWAGVVAQQ